MAEQITNYKCPNCTAPLQYVGESGKLECEFCGGRFDVAEIEALYREQDQKAKEEFTKAEEQRQEAEASWDMSELSQDWGNGAEGMRSYCCPSCGAELICEETTAATSCPYCGNNAIVPGQFDGALKPDYVIPFKLDKKAAIEGLKNHYRKKIFLPGAFTKANHLEEIQGLYVPFWLFDGEADADCTYHGTRSQVTIEGDYEVTTTQHYDVRRAGTVGFRRIPVDGAEKMPDAYMDALEPFDYGELKAFSTAYLPGYLADKFDVSLEKSAQRADLRCRNSAEDAMRRDVGGYATLVPTGKQIRLQPGAAHYALMPVWTLHTKWQGKDYLFMMNGQTGKMVGDLPVSKAKFWGMFAGLSAVLSGLAIWWGIGFGIATVFLG